MSPTSARATGSKSAMSPAFARASGSKTNISLDTWVASVVGLQNWEVSTGPERVYIDFATSNLQCGSVPPIDLCQNRGRSVSFADSNAFPGACKDPGCLFCREFGKKLNEKSISLTQSVVEVRV